MLVTAAPGMLVHIVSEYMPNVGIVLKYQPVRSRAMASSLLFSFVLATLSSLFKDGGGGEEGGINTRYKIQ